MVELMRISALVTLSFVVSSCASVRKEIYFVDANKPIEKTISYSGVSPYFVSSPIEISSTEKLSVSANIKNSAGGAYVFGIIIPFIPVFWFPEFSFSLADEDIQISCGTSFLPGKEYLEAQRNGKYFLNKKGSEIIEQRKQTNGGDRCLEVVLVMPDGQVVQPKKIEADNDGRNSGTLFTFAVPVKSLKAFQFKVTKLRLATGEELTADLNFQAQLIDWTRYVLFSPN